MTGRRMPLRPIPGASEKGARNDPAGPYLDPTPVPLAEKAKASGVTPGQGTRQIGPVTSGEGVPAFLSDEEGLAGRSDKGVPTV